jgi:hypothetical protein
MDDSSRRPRAEQAKSNREASRLGPLDASVHHDLAFTVDELCLQEDLSALGRGLGRLDFYTGHRQSDDGSARQLVAHAQPEHHGPWYLDFWFAVTPHANSQS